MFKNIIIKKYKYNLLYMPKKIKKSNYKNEFLKQFSDLSYDRNETVGKNEY